MLQQERYLGTHETQHGVGGGGQAFTQMIRFRESAGEDELAHQDPGPEPLVHEGIAVSEGQGNDGLGGVFQFLQAMEHPHQGLGAFASADDELGHAGAAGGEQGIVTGLEIRRQRLHPAGHEIVVGARLVGYEGEGGGIGPGGSQPADVGIDDVLG